MLIERILLQNATKTQNGYTAEVELETADGLGFCGSIEFDKDWNYDLGFLDTFVNTDEDKIFVKEVFATDDFKNDVISFVSEE